MTRRRSQWRSDYRPPPPAPWAAFRNLRCGHLPSSTAFCPPRLAGACPAWPKRSAQCRPPRRWWIPALLVAAASAIRDRELLRFDYRRHDGQLARREAEPHRLLHAGRRWYLVGWDTAAEAWRTYRVDRMVITVPNGRRFAPREPPTGGFEAYLTDGLSIQTWPVVGRFLMHAPIEQLRGKSHLTEGMLAPVDERQCILTVGADSEAMLLVLVGIYDCDFTVLHPPGAIQ